MSQGPRRGPHHRARPQRPGRRGRRRVPGCGYQRLTGRILQSLCRVLAGRWLQQHTWIVRAMSFEIVFNTLREREIYISIHPHNQEGCSWQHYIRRERPRDSGRAAKTQPSNPSGANLEPPAPSPLCYLALFLTPSGSNQNP